MTCISDTLSILSKKISEVGKDFTNLLILTKINIKNMNNDEFQLLLQKCETFEEGIFLIYMRYH